MSEPKFKIGQEVKWNGQKIIIQGFRNYQDYCWVYDFFPKTGTILPFHFTGIPEREISAISNKSGMSEFTFSFRGTIYRWRYRDMFWSGGDPLSRTTILTWLGFQWSTNEI